MNNNVIFTRTDKGNIIMALDDKMYVSKVTEMLQDTETYEVIKRSHKGSCYKFARNSCEVERCGLYIQFKIKDVTSESLCLAKDT